MGVCIQFTVSDANANDVLHLSFRRCMFEKRVVSRSARGDAPSFGVCFCYTRNKHIFTMALILADVKLLDRSQLDPLAGAPAQF
jgi:hypothetical protein